MSKSMKAKDLRKKLFNVIELIEEGKLSPSDGRNIVGAANQMNLSVQSEIKLMKLQMDAGQAVNALGEMKMF